jgi:hypothetical protein
VPALFLALLDLFVLLGLCCLALTARGGGASLVLVWPIGDAVLGGGGDGSEERTVSA